LQKPRGRPGVDEEQAGRAVFGDMYRALPTGTVRQKTDEQTMWEMFL
jgi:hypothetical protein